MTLGSEQFSLPGNRYQLLLSQKVEALPSPLRDQHTQTYTYEYTQRQTHSCTRTHAFYHSVYPQLQPMQSTPVEHVAQDNSKNNASKSCSKFFGQNSHESKASNAHELLTYLPTMFGFGSPTIRESLIFLRAFSAFAKKLVYF